MHSLPCPRETLPTAKDVQTPRRKKACVVISFPWQYNVIQQRHMVMMLATCPTYRRKKAVQSFLVQLRTIFAENRRPLLQPRRNDQIRRENTHKSGHPPVCLAPLASARRCIWSSKSKALPGYGAPSSRRTRPHQPCHAAATGLCTGPSLRSVSDVFRALMVADTIPRRDYVRRHVERGHAARAKHTSWVVCCHASEAPAALSCGYAGLYPGEKQRR